MIPFKESFFFPKEFSDFSILCGQNPEISLCKQMVIVLDHKISGLLVEWTQFMHMNTVNRFCFAAVTVDIVAQATSQHLLA